MARDVKAKVWKSLDKLFAYCDKVSWNKSDQQTFEQEVKNFGKAMKEAWTTCNITHYMVTTLSSCQFFNSENKKIFIFYTFLMLDSFCVKTAHYLQPSSVFCEEIWMPCNLVDTRNGEITLHGP